MVSVLNIMSLIIDAPVKLLFIAPEGAALCDRLCPKNKRHIGDRRIDRLDHV